MNIIKDHSFIPIFKCWCGNVYTYRVYIRDKILDVAHGGYMHRDYLGYMGIHDCLTGKFMITAFVIDN